MYPKRGADPIDLGDDPRARGATDQIPAIDGAHRIEPVVDVGLEGRVDCAQVIKRQPAQLDPPLGRDADQVTGDVMRLAKCHPARHEIVGELGRHEVALVDRGAQPGDVELEAVDHAACDREAGLERLDRVV